MQKGREGKDVEAGFVMVVNEGRGLGSPDGGEWRASVEKKGRESWGWRFGDLERGSR